MPRPAGVTGVFSVECPENAHKKAALHSKAAGGPIRGPPYEAILPGVGSPSARRLLEDLKLLLGCLGLGFLRVLLYELVEERLGRRFVAEL
jgi:hypothetical protein